MKRVYKKSILFLALACLTCSAVTAQNLLLNPDFESGVLAPWTAGNNSTVTLESDAHAGDFAARGNIEQIVALEAGKNFTYSTYVKCLGGCTENMWIGIRDIDGEMLVANFQFSDFSEYALASIDFTTATTGNYRFWVWGQGEADYISDSFLLLEEGTTSTSEAALEAAKINISSSVEGIMIAMDPSISTADVQIHDFSGKVVLTENGVAGQTFIDGSRFATGGYYVATVRTDKTVKSTKVIVYPR